MTTTSTNLLDIILPFLFPIVVLSFIALSIWLVMTLIRRNNEQDSAGRSKQRTASTARSPRRASANPASPPLIQVRHVSTGQWEIKIQGQRYSSLEAVPDDALRQEVIQGLRALAAFARSYAKATRKQKTSGTPPREEAPQQTKSGPAQSQPPTSSTASSPTSAPPVDTAREKTQRDQVTRSSPSFHMLKEPALRRHEAAPEFMPTIDLAREIGDIVDDMKANNPDLANRSVRLYNSPGGGIYFAVDGETFENVEDIPDMQIQGLIRAATKEWERR